jgi:dissimilatory sulfite reductase (desulfoviridin) alpha/beta subunit
MTKRPTDNDYLKDKGFLSQRQDDYFSLRLHVAGGNLTSENLRAIADAADKFGNGYIHVTSRQGIEVPFVHIDNVERISSMMHNEGISPGASGKKIRAVVACQGNRVCKNGIIDCQDICEKIDEKYFGQPIPHKFKIAVTGCPASCLKAQENDFGIMGTVQPKFVKYNCVTCGLCKKTCKVGAISIADGVLTLDPEKCIMCGDCIRVCKKDAMQVAKDGFTIFVGGRVGRKPRMGIRILKTVSEPVMFEVLERTVAYYRENALEDERIIDVIDRCGIDNVERSIGYSFDLMR